MKHNTIYIKRVISNLINTKIQDNSTVKGL